METKMTAQQALKTRILQIATEKNLSINKIATNPKPNTNIDAYFPRMISAFDTGEE